MSRLKRLLREIHERSLWQALVVYLGASYAVLEAAAYFRDEFGLPDWLPSVALVLLLIGLPVVVVTALAKEEAYGDEVPAQDAEAAAAEDRRLRLLTWRTAGLSFLSALALWGIIAAGLLLTGTYDVVAADERRSIAVLPFENLSPDPDDAYFTDGIHEEIISQLGIIASLKVISRTSVMVYRDREENLRTIANELGVTHILEGSVRRAGDQVRITTQLIAADEDERLWAENYDRALTIENVLGVQSEVALRISESLKATLTAEEAERIEQRPTDNLEAYTYYLKGRQHYNRGLNSEILKAIEMYQRAVALDTTFALAYAGMSIAYSHTYRATQARLSAEKALQLQPDLSEAHEAFGWYYYYLAESDYDKAQESFSIALGGQPNNAEVLFAMGLTERRHGRWNQALEDLLKALELEPLSSRKATEVGISYLFARRYEEAVRYFERATTISPDVPRAYLYLAAAYMAVDKSLDRARSTLRRAGSAMGRAEFAKALFLTGSAREPRWLVFDEYEVEFKSIIPEAPDPQKAFLLMVMAELHAGRGRRDVQRDLADSALVVLNGMARPNRMVLARAHANAGHKEEAIREAQEAIRRRPISDDARGGPDRLWYNAIVLTLLGEIEPAIDQLERLREVPSEYSLVALSFDPIWAPLRDHPRFQALLAKYDQPTE